MGPGLTKIGKTIGHGLSFIPGVSKGLNKVGGFISGLNKKTGGILGKTLDVAHELSPYIAAAGPYGKAAAAGIEGIETTKEIVNDASKSRGIKDLGGDLKKQAIGYIKDKVQPKLGGIPQLGGIRKLGGLPQSSKLGGIKSKMVDYANKKIRKSGGKFISGMGEQEKKKPKMGNPHPLSTTQPVQRMPSLAETSIERTYL